MKLVLLDNAALGLVRQQQHLFYRQQYVGSRFERQVDFVAIARGFGLEACDLRNVPDPALALRQAMVSSRATLIRVPINESEQVLPMVAPGRANTDPVDHPRGVTVDCS